MAGHPERLRPATSSWTPIIRRLPGRRRRPGWPWSGCMPPPRPLSAQMREKDGRRTGCALRARAEYAAAELERPIAVLKNNVQNNLDNAQRIRATWTSRKAGRTAWWPDRPAAGAAGRDRGQADSDAGGAAGQERAGPGGGPVCRDTGTGAGGTAAEGRPWRRPPPPRPRPCSPPWRLPLRRCWTGTRRCARSCGSWTAGWRRGAAQRQARKALAKAVEERDAVQNVISGYALRLESRRKKAEQARERHMKLQMDENALSSRVKMLTEMEKLHEGYPRRSSW